MKKEASVFGGKMKKINIAIVGYGGMGAYHGGFLNAHEKYIISGIYDIDESRYEVAKNNGIKNYDRFHSKEEIAEDKSVDAVLIATPNDLHCEYVKYFARAGKNVICEKPVAMSSEEYAEMLKVCEENGVVFMVHQNRRWDPDFLTIKKIVEENTIGKIFRIESRVQGGNGIPGDWRKFAEKGGGMMLDWGVHLIDQMVFLYRELPQSVYCNYFHVAGFDVDDGFRLEMRYRDGLTVEIAVDTNCFINLPRWQIYGTDGTAQIVDWELHGKVVKPEFSKEWKIAGIQAGNGFTKTMAYRSADSVTEYDLDRVYPESCAFYEEFYAVSVNGKTPLIQPREVMSVMKIMEAAKLSSVENKTIYLEEQK